MNSSNTSGSSEKSKNNIELFLPYAAPYFAYIALASVLHNKLSEDIIHMVQLVIVPAFLFWAWKLYIPFTGPKNKWASCLWGIVFGVIGLVVWCGLYIPFTHTENAEAWSTYGLVLRILAGGFVAPIIVELLMRGYIFRFALQWELVREEGVKRPFSVAFDEFCIDDVEPGQWSVFAVVISTVIFAAGHLVTQWPAAIAYGILMAFLWIWRKDLISCMIAHGTTNIGLALYVFYSGRWELW